MKTLPYIVQLADAFGFDFGGEDGGIAAFRNKGDAYAFAAKIRDRLHKATRVMDMTRRAPRVEFLLNPQ